MHLVDAWCVDKHVGALPLAGTWRVYSASNIGCVLEMYKTTFNFYLGLALKKKVICYQL